MLADAGAEPRRERAAALCLAASHAGAVVPTSKTRCEAMAHCPSLPCMEPSLVFWYDKHTEYVLWSDPTRGGAWEVRYG
jgi:hypothetical protein